MEGEIGRRFYLLVRGTVEVLKQVDDGPPQRLALLDDGEFFGEIALLAAVPRTATVRTRSRCQVLTLDRQQFENLLRVAPDLRSAFERTATRRQAELEEFVARVGRERCRAPGADKADGRPQCGSRRGSEVR